MIEKDKLVELMQAVTELHDYTTTDEIEKELGYKVKIINKEVWTL